MCDTVIGKSRALLSYLVSALSMWHPERVDAPRTARARARAELTDEIVAVARRQLGESGAGGLSLRAVARELGMVSSALYRYFPSRDDLLTRLIVDAYDALGAAAEEADAACRLDDIGARWAAAGRAVRTWALAHRHEYALIYGSPVPGYAAPTDTIGPATRLPAVIGRQLVDGLAAGVLTELDGDRPKPPRAIRADLRRMADTIAPGADPELMARAALALTELVGTVSFELFGQFNNVFDSTDAWFDWMLTDLARFVGLPAPGRRRR